MKRAPVVAVTPPAIGFYSTYKELKHFSISLRSCISSSVFIVPIRNWNRPFMKLLASAFLSFYSTYKELKHDWCISSHAISLRFYSTYKELKQVLPFDVQHDAPVFIVPIRNWNSDMPKSNKRSDTSFYSTYKELKHTQDKIGLGVVGRFL